MEMLTRPGTIGNASLDGGLNLGDQHRVERKILDPDASVAKGPDQKRELLGARSRVRTSNALPGP